MELVAMAVVLVDTTVVAAVGATMSGCAKIFFPLLPTRRLTPARAALLAGTRRRCIRRLIRATARSGAILLTPPRIVDVGSRCGKTVVLNENDQSSGIEVVDPMPSNNGSPGAKENPIPVDIPLEMEHEKYDIPDVSCPKAAVTCERVGGGNDDAQLSEVEDGNKENLEKVLSTTLNQEEEVLPTPPLVPEANLRFSQRNLGMAQEKMDTRAENILKKRNLEGLQKEDDSKRLKSGAEAIRGGVLQLMAISAARAAAAHRSDGFEEDA